MHRITLIPGDGIGPEVTQSAREVVDAAGVDVTWDVVGAGMQTGRDDGTPLPLFGEIAQTAKEFAETEAAFRVSEKLRPMDA